MKQAYSAFIHILRCHLRGEPLGLPASVPWDAVLELAKIHGLLPVLWCMLEGSNDVPDEVLASARRGFHAAVFMDAQLSHLREQIGQRFRGKGIAHAFLRGVCIKGDYPVPALRTMGDMDVLVRMEDYAAIHREMAALGGKPCDEDDNHRSYSFPTGACVEFHPNLLRHTSLGAVINPGWQYVDPGCTELNTEGHYLNLVCHLAHHFCVGGSGVRSVMDVWVTRHRRPIQPDREKVLATLEACGLRAFVENVEALAEAWFGAGEMTPVLEALGEYILTSGAFGTRERKLLSAAAFSGSKWSSLGARVFPPKVILEDSYPWSKGKPLLLPAAWFARLVSKTTHAQGTALKCWGKDNLSITDEAVQRQKDLLRTFGFQIPR